jgi:predicted NBD/HSP70 family sugar kinase
MRRTAAARPDAIRRHNLGLLLQQIHLDGALSRAELTQRSGLSRSTVGGLVTELSGLGLVSESVPLGGTRAGRPSFVVQPHPDGFFAVAVDIDVTRVTTAAVGIGGEVLARHVVTTVPGPVTPETVAHEVASAVPLLRDLVGVHSTPVGIGISVPGTVDRRTGVVGLAPNLGWRDIELGRLMTAAAPVGLPVSIGNDADLAVLAEHRRGSARGYEDVVYLLGRIGLGAGILVDGRSLHGSGGLAGEVGHTVLDPAGLPCHCGGRGCAETFVGDAALLRLAGRKPAAGDGPASDGHGVAEVLRAAGEGEERALKAVQALADHLGRVAANLVNLLNPQLVIMGGSLREVLVLAQPHVEAALDRHAMAAARGMVELRPSALGDDGPLLGAAELAFGELLTDPLGVTTSAVPAVQLPPAVDRMVDA